jgi:hypothetical protein
VARTEKGMEGNNWGGREGEEGGSLRQGGKREKTSIKIFDCMATMGRRVLN